MLLASITLVIPHPPKANDDATAEKTVFSPARNTYPQSQNIGRRISQGPYGLKRPALRASKSVCSGIGRRRRRGIHFPADGCQMNRGQSSGRVPCGSRLARHPPSSGNSVFAIPKIFLPEILYEIPVFPQVFFGGPVNFCP
jgi:hypothetical protein